MKNILVFTTLWLASGLAFAGVLNERGGYVGVGVGLTSFDDDGLYSNFGYALTDDEDGSAMIYGGYRFFKYLAVEGRLIDLGTYEVSGEDLEYGAFTITAQGIVPFGQSGWEIYGNAGLGIVTRDADFSGIDDDEGGLFTLGIGVRFTPAEHFSLAIQADGYAWVEEGVFTDYDMSIGTTSLLVQYNF